MSSSPKSTGAEHLVRKSDLAKARQALPPIKDILIIEDKPLDADRLLATLRSLFGYDLDVRRTNTLSKGIDMLLVRHPDLILLDDYLEPSDTALDSLPMIRHAGFEGPIVVISGQMDRHRRAALMGKGADETINKDDLDTSEITAALMQVAGKLTKAQKPII